MPTSFVCLVNVESTKTWVVWKSKPVVCGAVFVAASAAVQPNPSVDNLVIHRKSIFINLSESIHFKNSKRIALLDTCSYSLP